MNLLYNESIVQQIHCIFMLKIKPNPGGLIDPKHVIGRDIFIEDLWQTLEQQSVILLAERRIGKSSILRKIEDESQESWLPILWDVEHVDSVERFVEGLNDKIIQYTSVKNRGESFTKKIFKALAGAKAWGFQIPQAGDINSRFTG